MIGVTIVSTPVWAQLEPHLHIVECARDGGILEARIRIEFLDLPERLSRDLVMFEMPCVDCGRPNHPLRRRQGDGWDRLYYAPTCPIAVRVRCSRGRAAELEYERFKGIAATRSPLTPAQLSLFER